MRRAVDWRSLVYNPSTRHEKHQARKKRGSQWYSYSSLFQRRGQPANVQRILVSPPCTFRGSRGVRRHIRKAVDCPTRQISQQTTIQCPEILQQCPEGPLTIFVDGSWKDNSNGIESIFTPQFIPRDKQVGGAGLVIIADRQDWRGRGIATIHLNEGKQWGRTHIR